MMFGREPLVVMDSRWWPAIADALIASGAPWPEDAILADLRWWQDQERMGRVRRPGRPTLEKRWKVGGSVAKRLLKAELRWGLEQEPTSDRPATDQPLTSASEVEPAESVDIDQPLTSDRPATVPTRVGTFIHSTDEHSEEQQPALLPDLPAAEPKPKRRGKPQPPAPDPEAIGRCLDLWASVSGKREGATPGKGLHKAVGEALAKGINVELRMAYLVSLNGTGTADWAKSNGVKLSAFLRAKSKLTDPLDAEAEEWDASGRPVALSPMPARAGPRRAAGFWEAFDQEYGPGEVFDGE